MTNKKKTESEAEINPIDESRELEKAQAAAGFLNNEIVEPQPDKQYIILTRENFMLIATGLWKYRHDAALSECKVPTAFKGEMATNFGVRTGDVVICTNGTQVELVVVPE